MENDPKAKSTHEHAMKVFDQHTIDRISRLLINSKKAIEEHIKKEHDHIDIFALPEQAIPPLDSILSCEPQPRLKFSYQIAEEKGSFRETMEDAYFYKVTKYGVLTGIFDGHGGREVADFSSTAFNKRFPRHLQKAGGNVRAAFETFFNTIHDEVAKNQIWDRTGSTAIVCFIEKQTNLIYTATLGDSEANIYRYYNGTLKSIPLSCVRDWSHPKEAKRASVALNDPSIADSWPQAAEPKLLRYPSIFRGVNVSRAIGDMHWSEAIPFAISHTPKISLNRVLKGDRLVLSCDGLKDYVTEKTIVEIVDDSIKENKNTAAALVNFATDIAQSEDNVTVISISIE